MSGIDAVDQHTCHVRRLGRVEYLKAWKIQRRLAEERAAERIPDTLLLLEHPPTYTLGRRSDDSHFLTSCETLECMGASIHRVDRGGGVTFHGPGQLVGYPIISIRDRQGGVIRYLRDIEEVLIQTLSGLGIDSGRLPGYTGVWVGSEKIAAIGIKVNARQVCGHGFALNVSTDLNYFAQIVPCGIRDKGVTSISKLLAGPVGLHDVSDRVVVAFGGVFGWSMLEAGNTWGAEDRGNVASTETTGEVRNV